MALVSLRDTPSDACHLATQVWLHGWTRSELDEDQMEILKGENIHPARKPHGWSINEAIKFLSDAVHAKDWANDRNIRPRKQPPQTLPYALFNDIDKALFGGVLRGNVHLRFDKNLPSGLAGVTTWPSQIKKSRIRVELSKDLTFKQAPAVIIEALMHQMIHAYLLQCCGTHNGRNNHDLRHGLGFSTAALVVLKACGFRPLMEFPSLLGVMAQKRWGSEVGGSSTSSAWETSSDCCSAGVPFEDCMLKLESIQEGTHLPEISLDYQCPLDKNGERRPITQYYHTFKDGRFKPILRGSSQGLPVDHLELHFKGKAIPVACPLSLRTSETTTRGSTPVLVMPSTDEKAFGDVYRFLTTGSYAHPVEGWGRPPRIGHGVGVEAPVCHRDIRAYRHGSSLGIPELQKYALDRLWTHSVTFEDPVAALDFLYHGLEEQREGEKKANSKSSAGEESKNKRAGNGKDGQGARDDKKKESPRGPDEALRNWAREWLKIPHKEYGCNLNLIKRHAGWGDAWRRLKAKGGPLIIDVDAVEEELRSLLMTPEVWPQRGGYMPRSQSYQAERTEPQYRPPNSGNTAQDIPCMLDNATTVDGRFVLLLQRSNLGSVQSSGGRRGSPAAL